MPDEPAAGREEPVRIYARVMAMTPPLIATMAES
jgi:hypothetical protein